MYVCVILLSVSLQAILCECDVRHPGTSSHSLLERPRKVASSESVSERPNKGGLLRDSRRAYRDSQKVKHDVKQVDETPPGDGETQEIFYVDVQDDAGDEAIENTFWNDSDVIDVYAYDDVPGIWESRRPRSRSKGQAGVLPKWQRLPTLENISRFKKLVQQTMACRQLPALTLALVKGGHVILTANLGHADPELHVPVTRSTRFAIGSLTKAFTSTVVSEVLWRRNISLDTPIDQLMPDSFQLMDEVRTRSVTTRDLLGHRTGVPGYFHALMMGFPSHVTRRQLLSRLRYVPAVVPLRSEFLYNNYLYTLAAHVVEHLTGRSWEALVRDHILRPLGMRSTGFVDETKDFGQFALPCALVNGTLRNLAPELLLSVSPCGPAGSLYSTAHDMARWLQLLLGNGSTPDGKRVVQESVLEETTRPVMPPPGIGTDLTRPDFPVADVEQSYGMGWITSNYRGYRKVWHSGGIVTFSSRLWLLPGAGAGLFVATNGPQTKAKGHALTAITSMAADLLLGEKFWLNSSTVCTFPAPWKPTSETSRHTAADTATSSTEDRVPRDRSTEKGTKRGSEEFHTRHLPDEELMGVYSHKAFGDMVIEQVVQNDVTLSETDVTEPVIPKGHDHSESATGSGNSSERLLLKFGRFGKLKLTRVRPDRANQWEGRFVGPLWYVTASDESRDPLRVQFLQDDAGNVDGIRFPIDGKYDIIEFEKRQQDPRLSSSYSASCRGCSFKSVVLAVAVSHVLGICMVWRLTPM
ncbi:hypothetical protein V1264_004941 [Littorina saxatilis]|uniref:Beta-lactamase-related domain-containing protein n=1 Tax=Littorina saxatilis TaxID=31220 RepID=A0AAN9B368_9CAEN